MKTKHCLGCDRSLPLSRFHGPYRRKNGAEWYTSRCKACVLDQKRALYQARKLGTTPAVPPLEQQCRDCLQVKPASHFGVDMAKVTGLKIYCKPCANLRTRASKYGLSRPEIAALFERSGHRCEVCLSPDRLVIDHDHGKTGPESVRGILCDDCNVSLGRLSDDPERIRRLAAYVERR